MKMLSLAGFCVLLCFPRFDAAAAQAPAGPVALVYSLAGEAALTLPAGERRPLRLFDRLAAGATLEVGPGSRLALAFANGRRYGLGERSRATLGRSDLASRSGPVQPLRRVPSLPRILPIAEEDHPGLRAGAVRIRAERIAGLYPREGATALAGATVLRFEPVDGAGRYRIEVQDVRGGVVFATETAAPPVKLPPGTLQPDLRYAWTVRTIERVGPVARGESDLTTLSARAAEAREALRRAVEEEGDAGSLALLAEVDRSLGLLAEAREELWAALRETPGDAALAEALAELERRLAEESPGIGVVIEDVTPESLGARAGLQPGDLLLSWCRAEPSAGSCLAGGRFRSPFDFDEMDLEEGPRGGVMILGEHAGRSSVWALLPGAQSAQVRPVLPKNLLELLQEGRSLAAAERVDAAVERWRAAAVEAKGAGEDLLGIWFLSQAAGALAGARTWPQADALYREAAEQAQLLGITKIDAHLSRAWGRTRERRGSWQEAQSLYRRSLQLDRAAGRDLTASGVLHQLGTMAAQRGDLQEAEALLGEALAIRAELAPDSSNLAKTLMNLGMVTFLRGELASAESHLRRVLSIQEALAPGSNEVADALINLATVVSNRGSHAVAEELYRRAKAIYEKIKPESLEMAKVLKNLSNDAVSRYDEETAEHFLLRALEIEEKLDSSGAALAITLDNLGNQALRRGDLKSAEQYFRRALSLAERVTPDGLALAPNLDNLGMVALRRRDCATAGAHFQRAFAIRQRLNPDSLDVSWSLENLGDMYLECGDLPNAEDHYRQALALLERLAPGAFRHVMSLQGMGEVYRRQGRSLSAEEFLCRAADVSERSNFGRREAYDKRLFTDCLQGRIEIGRTTEAFHVLERGRARAFLEQLTERDLLFSADLPDEIAHRRRQLARELESTQAALARIRSTRDTAEAERLLNQLREIRDQQWELVVEIRKRSPRFASVQYPEPLDLGGVRRALDPGTVLLSYAVDEEKSYLFVVHPPEVQGPGLSVFPLPIGEQALREAVQSFRNLLQTSDSGRSQLTSRASELYGLLIGPAEAQIAAAKRILVSTDGPLHTLPFAALVRQGQYLVEWKPLHSILSATVYAELKRARRTTVDPAQSQLVAFGDPSYPPLPEDRETAPAATLEVLTAVRRGLSLDPIPATRHEVESIASLYPRARIYLGAEATEERAKAVGSGVRLLHFASHGLLNERFPLDSALALTLPRHPEQGRDNGLLQAWEILESVRLDADLVTLSACDTALGKEMGGEGLIGLTRAFQYAGARSVLASLWSVSDVSTADLMKRFYGHLRAGKAKDEALQAAQVALIRSPAFSHPYHWAAFQLSGDWR